VTYVPLRSSEINSIYAARTITTHISVISTGVLSIVHAFDPLYVFVALLLKSKAGSYFVADIYYELAIVT
jgi:hypothetical protein